MTEIANKAFLLSSPFYDHFQRVIPEVEKFTTTINNILSTPAFEAIYPRYVQTTFTPYEQGDKSGYVRFSYSSGGALNGAPADPVVATLDFLSLHGGFKPNDETAEKCKYIRGFEDTQKTASHLKTIALTLVMSNMPSEQAIALRDELIKLDTPKPATSPKQRAGKKSQASVKPS